MTVLQSFPPEICSLICEDPILERLDLNSICFISHAFRNEAQRELSNHFPCLRGASAIKAWCLPLECHRSKNIKGLALLLPDLSTFGGMDFLHLTWKINTCENLKELVVLFEEQERKNSSLRLAHIPPLAIRHSQLTKLVNGYFSQETPEFVVALKTQPNLESLELHSGKTNVFINQLSSSHHCLKTLGCPPQFLNSSYNVTRLRLDFKNSTDYCEIDELGRVLNRNLSKNMNSLVILLDQWQSHFAEIICVIAVNHMHIQHLEIHQFFPTQVEKYLPLPASVNSYGRNINLRTLVFRPPPGLSNLCAYVELRTPVGRRKVAEELITRTFPTLTRLVLVVHGSDYEFRRDLSSGVITGEILITRDKREWTLIK